MVIENFIENLRKSVLGIKKNMWQLIYNVLEYNIFFLNANIGEKSREEVKTGKIGDIL